MNLNNDLVDRRFRLGPLRKRHTRGSRSLVRDHNRLHPAPHRFAFSPFGRLGEQNATALRPATRGDVQVIGASDREGLWPCGDRGAADSSGLSPVLPPLLSHPDSRRIVFPARNGGGLTGARRACRSTVLGPLYRKAYMPLTDPVLTPPGSGRS